MSELAVQKNTSQVELPPNIRYELNSPHFTQKIEPAERRQRLFELWEQYRHDPLALSQLKIYGNNT